MRQFRVILIALITSLAVINTVFLRKTVAALLCGVLSFNSTSCYSFLGEDGKADAAVPSGSVVTSPERVGAVRKDEQKLAGCFLGVCVNLPTINIPKIGSPDQPAPTAPTPTSSVPPPTTPEDNSGSQSITSDPTPNGSDSQSNQINLTGTWSQTGTVFTIDGRGCTAGYAGTLLVNGKDSQGFVFPITQSGNQWTVPTVKTSWTGGGNATEATRETVTGNKISGIDEGTAGGGFTYQFTGTISADGNKITATGICRANAGGATANGTFTWTRKLIAQKSCEGGLILNSDDKTTLRDAFTVGTQYKNHYFKLRHCPKRTIRLNDETDPDAKTPLQEQPLQFEMSYDLSFEILTVDAATKINKTNNRLNNVIVGITSTGIGALFTRFGPIASTAASTLSGEILSELSSPFEWQVGDILTETYSAKYNPDSRETEVTTITKLEGNRIVDRSSKSKHKVFIDSKRTSTEYGLPSPPFGGD